jgi:hypothetical protein
MNEIPPGDFQMALMRVTFLGNGAWGNEFLRKAPGDPTKQQVWFLIFDDGKPGNYSFEITSLRYNWEIDGATPALLVPLVLDYKLFVVRANPTLRSGMVPSYALAVHESVTITVTNQTTGQQSPPSTQPVVIVDGLKFFKILDDAKDEELLDRLPKSDEAAV